MKTTAFLLLLFILVLGGGYLWNTHQQATIDTSIPAIQTSKDAAISNPASSTTSTIASATNQPGSYTSTQIALHNTSKDCWSSINGNVYNLTSWVSQHPGGEAAILSICGKDGSQAFNQQHGSGRNTRPQDMLATFKIGTLAH